MRSKNFKQSRGEIGKYAESIAAKFLKKSNVQIVEKNYSCRYGEIDIIGRYKKLYYFFEVRSRKSQEFGDAVSSITGLKLKRIKMAIKVWSKLRNIEEESLGAIYILSLDWSCQNNAYNISYFKV